MTTESADIMELALEARVNDIIEKLVRISSARVESKRSQQYAI
jgi:hypothetical protein